MITCPIILQFLQGEQKQEIIAYYVNTDWCYSLFDISTEKLWLALHGAIAKIPRVQKITYEITKIYFTATEFIQ